MPDHQIKIDSTTKNLTLLRQDGRALYQVSEDVPSYRNPLLITQSNWIGGHGQYDLTQSDYDKYMGYSSDMYFEGQSIDTTQPNRIILGPLITEVKESDSTDLDSAPVVFKWFNAVSAWLCATAGKIYIYDSSNNYWTAATTTVAGVTHLCEYNDIMYAARGASTKYSYSADGDTWTQTDLTDGYANEFIVAPNPAGTQDVLRKFKTPNEISYTTDGRTVSGGGEQWSSPAYIGDISNNITNMFLVNDNFMVGKEDNLFHYDSNGGLHPLRDDLKENRSSDNFKYVTKWQTGTYFSEIDGMGEITSYNAYSPMGALFEVGNIGKRGDCVGLSSDKDFIYSAIDEGTNTHIYKGREKRTNEGLKWQWCPWVFLGTKACSTIATCQHSATDRRLWFGYGNNTAYVVLSDNPTADSAARFASSGWIRMSYTYGTNPYWDKMVQSIVTRTNNCSANLTVTPKYRKDTDSSATALTSAITTNGTVKTNLTSALSCKRIQFELHLATNSSSSTPEVYYFEVRGYEKPETFRVHTCTYSLGDKPTQQAETIRTFLRGGRTSTSLIRFSDLRYLAFNSSKTAGTAGTDFEYVIMLQHPREVEIMCEKGRKPELGIECVFQEVNFT